MLALSIHDRMMAVYRKRKPDRIPAAIYSRYHRLGGVERAARNLGLGIIDFHPVGTLLSPPWHLRSGYVSEVRRSTIEARLSWQEGEPVEVRTVRTPRGSVRQVSVKDPVFDSDWVREPYLKSPADYPVLRHIVENTVFRGQEEALAQKIKDLGEDGVVLGRVDRSPFQKLLIELANPQQFLIDIQTNPEPAERLMAAIEERLDEQFEMALGSPAEVIWQPDNLSADMTSPKLFEKYCLPYYEKQGTKCRRAGKVYALHADGRTRALRQGLAAAPVDVLESFSLPEIGGDVSVREAKEYWPGKVICPNFPASLCSRSRPEIESFLTRLWTEFGDETPFMLQISEDIPPSSYHEVLPIVAEFMADRAPLHPGT